MPGTITVGAAFAPVEKLVRGLVGRFVRAYGGDRAETFSDAFAYFCDALRDYRADGGASFPTFVYAYVHNGLIGGLRRRIYLRRKERGDAALLTAAQRQSPAPFDAQSFMDSLSEDARLVVSLTFDPPGQLEEILAEGESRSYAAVRRATKELLVRFGGWEPRRAEAAFKEIRSKL